MSRCGSCRFTRKANDQAVFCIGAPPTVVAVSQGEGDTKVVNSQAPILGRDHPRCALYKRRWLWWRR